MAKRIQRRRTKGWRMPAGAIYVGRPSPWGSPFKVGDVWDSPFVWHLPSWNVSLEDGDGCTRVDAALAVDLYRSWINDVLSTHRGYLDELRGHDLVCWCPEACGEPVALYGVPYGEQFDPCTKAAGHAGAHDPSAPPLCHADVVLELANA